MHSGKHLVIVAAILVAVRAAKAEQLPLAPGGWQARLWREAPARGN